MIVQLGKNAEIDDLAGSVEFSGTTEIAKLAKNANFANNDDNADSSEIDEIVDNGDD